MNVTGRRTGALLAVAATAALALGGCSASHPDAKSSSLSDSAGGAPERGIAQDSGAKAAQAPPAMSALASGAKATAGKPAKVSLSDRSIVYRGELTVRVKNIDKAASDIKKLAARLGGYVAADKGVHDDQDSTSDLTLRIPGKAFTEAVDAAAAVGKELKRDFSTEDVTEAVVDIQARIASQKASVDRVRELLSRADRITDLAAVEGELAQREADLASLEAQQRSLSGQVEYSTITVRLVGPTAKVAAAEKKATFLSAFVAGWDALVAAFNWLLIALGAVLPFLVVLGMPLALAFVALRRRRRSAAPIAAPADEPATP